MDAQPIQRRDLLGAAAAAGLVVAAAIVFYRFDPSFFWKDDFQLQYLPISREIVRAWREGSFPLLSRFSWFGGALAGEFQHGVFSVFMTACNFIVWSLPLELSGRAATLSSIHLAVMAAGVYAVARSYGLRATLATAAAFAVTLNGWNLWWGAATWYPSLASFAWLPWYWLSLRKASQSRLAWLGGGLSLYCLISAGWTFTILMAGLLTLLEALKALRNRCALLSIAAAAALGVALSAPATLMLLEYFRGSFRSGYADRFDVRWTVPIWSLIGLVLPTMRSQWPLWTAPMPHSAVELAGGLVPLAGLVGAAATRRWSLFRALRGELVLLLFLLLLTGRPSLGIIRWPFRWLPLLHLLLTIAGFAAIQQIGEEGSRVRDRAGLWCCAVIAAAMAIDWNLDDQPAVTLRYAVVLFVLAALWMIGAKVAANGGALAVTIASVAMLFLFFPQPREVPLWRIDSRILDPQPLDARVRYLQIARWPDDISKSIPGEPQRRIDGIGASLRPGDTPMLAGVEFVNGYSPVVPLGLRALFGFDTHGPIRQERLAAVGARETAPGALLDHMSVGGLIVAQRWANRAPLFAQRGWSLSARLDDGAVFTRPLAHGVIWTAANALMFADDRQAIDWITRRLAASMPVVLSGSPAEVRTYVPRPLSDLRSERLYASVSVGPAASAQKSLIVFSRPWFPGYRATIDGVSVPVLRADLIMPAVELRPDQRGLLVVRYRPSSLIVGVCAAIAGVLAAVAALLYPGRPAPDAETESTM